MLNKKTGDPYGPHDPQPDIIKNKIGVVGVMGATQKVDMTIYACACKNIHL